MVQSQWSVVQGSWSVVQSQWSVVQSSWSVVQSQWSVFQDLFERLKNLRCWVVIGAGRERGTGAVGFAVPGEVWRTPLESVVS